MPTKLESLKEHSIVVADTGDFGAIAKYRPSDCTTNPTLLLKAAQMSEYSEIVRDTIGWAQRSGAADVDDIVDRLAVAFGGELLGIVPGYVSTEVDADLSFDTNATIDKAKRLIGLYAERGFDTSRVLIKVASTWEGIKAAEQLQKDGINCNLTLLFGMPQARACADAGIFLISPFVGRIRDWYVKAGHTDFTDETDPGVQFVRGVYAYYKTHGYKTIVMGASFRNSGEILALAGCDRLTISPNLLDELASEEGQVPVKLSTDLLRGEAEDKLTHEEAGFRWHMNENAMATEKLAEGIRNFNKDLVALKKTIAEQI